MTIYLDISDFAKISFLVILLNYFLLTFLVELFFNQCPNKFYQRITKCLFVDMKRHEKHIESKLITHLSATSILLNYFRRKRIKITGG